MKWKSVQFDNRIGPNGGHLLSIANESRILYLGGFDKNGYKLDTIYELIEDKYWKLWPVKLPVPIGNDILITLPTKATKKCHVLKFPLGTILQYYKIVLKINLQSNLQEIWSPMALTSTAKG